MKNIKRITIALIAASALSLGSASAAGMKFCGYVHAIRGGTWTVTANHNTSCALARNVTYDSGTTLHPVSFSPVTGRYYRFDCYRSGHTVYYRRYTCVSFDGVDGPLRVVFRG